MSWRQMRMAVPLVVLAASAVSIPGAALAESRPIPADPFAGGHAATLHSNLVAANDPGQLSGFLFGQQHANWDSKRYRSVDELVLDWRGPRVHMSGFDDFVSDIELATTLLPDVDPRRPAVFGFSLRTALKLDDDGRRTYANQIIAAYASGGVVTMHYPADNPVTGGDHKDVGANALCLLSTDWQQPPEVAADAVAEWKTDLADGAEFLALVNDMWRDPDGDGVNERSGRVAIVFRPFHEMLRVRHWWSAAFYRSVPEVCDGSAATAFQSLWRQTFDYLVTADEPTTEHVEGLDVHGLLFAWSPDRPTSTPGWQSFYPNTGLDDDSARDYVDIIAFDVYETTPEAFSNQLVADMAAVTSFNAGRSVADREIIAIGEFGPASGLSTVSEGNWFMHHVIRPLLNAGLAEQIAYAMTWSNMDEQRYWVPLPCFNVPECSEHDATDAFYGAKDAPIGDPMRGFRAFVNHPSTVFLEDLPAWWRLPDASIPFQPGDSPDLIVRIPCWQGYDPQTPDLVQRLHTCGVLPTVGRLRAAYRAG